jgi:hypothetical protein
LSKHFSQTNQVTLLGRLTLADVVEADDVVEGLQRFVDVLLPPPQVVRLLEPIL